MEDGTTGAAAGGLPTLTGDAAVRLEHDHLPAWRRDWRVVKASGEGLRTYLQGQITQDMAGLKPDRGIHACVLTPQGKAVSELYLLEDGRNALYLLAPAVVAADAVARLRRFSLGYRLRIGILEDIAVASVLGRRAATVLTEWGLPVPVDSWLAAAKDACGEIAVLHMGAHPQNFWVIAPQGWLRSRLQVRDSMQEAVEALRIIRGRPQFGVEWDHSIHPLNANLIETEGVCFDKGCYVGQEIVSRMHWRGGIRKKLYRIEMPEAPPDFAPPLPCPVYTSAPIGSIRSLARDADDRLFGMALLAIASVRGGEELWAEGGLPLRLLGACGTGWKVEKEEK